MGKDYHPKIQKSPKDQQTPRNGHTQKAQKTPKTLKQSVKKKETNLAEEKERVKIVKESVDDENGRIKDKGEYVGVEDEVASEEGNDPSEAEIDGLDDIWKKMNFALECSKDTTEDPPDERVKGPQDMCDHSYVLKDDIGYVCRVCGFIQRGIEEITEYT